MIAAIYARKSTDQSDRADEAKSVARQIEYARAFAASKGWTVDDAHIYVDDGISGADTKRLLAKERLMRAVGDGCAPFQVLVMQANDRLSRRDGDEAISELKAIARAGVDVWFYADNSRFEWGTFAANTLAFLKAEFAAEERRKSSQRTTESMVRKARAGFVTGGRCFGYSNVRNASGVRRETLEPEAVIVRRIFELAASGLGYKGIARRLNDDGALCPRSQRGRPAGWAPSSVREVLLRTVYRGEVTWNRTRKRDASGEARAADRPEHEWIRVPVPELRIVTDELWEAAHGQLAGQRTRAAGPVSYGGRKNVYLLTGLLRCGTCGAGMEIRRQKRGRMRTTIVHCSAHHRKGAAVCPNARTVVMADAEGAILAALRQTLLNPEVLAEAVTRAAARLTSPPSDAAERVSELHRLDAEIGRLTDAIAAGGPLEALVGALRDREARRRALAGRIAHQRAQATTEDRTGLVADLRHRVGEWRALLDGATGEARQILRLLVIDRLTMRPLRDGYHFSGTGTAEPVIAGVIRARTTHCPS